MIFRRLLAASAALALSTVVAAQDSRPIARIYDMRDLLPKPTRENARPAPPESEPALVNAIRAFMPPPLTSETLFEKHGSLAVTVTPAQHEWLQGFLIDYRRRLTDVFRVETQFVVASVEQAARIGIDDGLPVYVTDDLALTVVRDEIAAMKGAFVGPLETTEIVNGLQGRDEMFEELTYVKAYAKHVNVEPGRRTLVVPVLATEKEGSFLDALAIGLPGDRIGCILKATLSRIEKPVPTRDTPDGPIAVPVVTTMSIEAKATFDGRMTILFPGPARDGRVPFVLTKVSLKPH